MAHHHTWVTRVLPYIDQAALFNKFNMSASSWDNTGSPSNRSLVGSSVTGIRCPSEAGGTDSSSGSKGVTITSYAACEGYDWWQRSPGGAGPENDGGIGKGGIFTANVWTKIAEITDGTSNTILIGEATAPGYDGGPANTSGLGRPRVGDPLFRSALTAADWHGDTSYGKDHITNAYRMRVDGSAGSGGDHWFNFGSGGGSQPYLFPPVFGAHYGINGNWPGAFSLHAGGAGFALADGSVRFVSQDVDWTMWNNLCSRGSRDKVGEF